MDPKSSGNPFAIAFPQSGLNDLVNTVGYGEEMSSRGRLMRVLRQDVPTSYGDGPGRPVRGEYVWFYDFNPSSNIVVVTDSFSNKHEFYTIDLVFVEV